MPTNVYFNPGVMSEQRLYEDMIEESLRIYGQDVYYIPRFLKNFDAVLDDAVASEFNQAYFIEMYIDESGYSEILRQVRDSEFEKQLNERLSNAVEIAVLKKEKE